jgi:hypothetical protein
VFESICKYREESNSKDDPDTDDEQSLEWFERLALKLLTNGDD